MAVSSFHPMKSSPQCGSTHLKHTTNVQRAFPSLRKKTNTLFRGTKTPKQHHQGASNGNHRGVRVVCSASYPYSSGPWSRQSYGGYYTTTSAQNYQQQEDVASSRPFGDWMKTIQSCSSFLVTALTRGVARIAPQGTSKETIRTGVKAGLVLLVLMFARSILSLLIAVGSVGVLMFIGSRFITPQLMPPPRPHPEDPQRVAYQPRYYQPGVYYPPPGPMYQPRGVYDSMDGGVIDPWTADVLTVWREPIQPQMVTPSYQYQQLNHYSRFTHKRPVDESN